MVLSILAMISAAGTPNTSAILSGGNLFGTGTLDYGVVDTATITPGDSSKKTGKLQVNGTYTQNAGGALDVTLRGTTAGTQYDQLNVSGTASLNGTLNVTLAAGYKPGVGTQFDILNASSISGTFSAIDVTNSSDTFKAVLVGDEIELTVETVGGPASSANLTQSMRMGAIHGRSGLGGYTGKQLAVVTPGGVPFIPTGMPLGLKTFHPRDDFGSPAVADIGGASTLGMSPVSAAAYNSMAAMDHMRFECGVDLGELRKTSPRRLLRALWASPDSKDALNIGYMTMTTAH